jgi:hypothetical protein
MKRPRGIVPWVLVAWLGAGSTAHAQSAADVAAARELFNQGSTLARDGQWEAARDRYQRAYALSGEPIALYSLGVAQKETGRLVDALESLRRFLKSQSSPKTEAYVEPARRAVAELEGQVGALSIELKPPGVEGLVLKVDGVEVPPAAHGMARLVDPGEIEVVARAPGYRPSAQHVTLAPGEKRQIEITLEAAPADPTGVAAASPQAAQADEPAPAPTGDGSLVLPIALMGGGVAVFGAGVVVGLVGVGQASDAPTSDGPEADDARTLSLVGDILAGVGIATAGVGAAILVFGGDDEAPASASAPVRVHVGTGSFALRGAF